MPISTALRGLFSFPFSDSRVSYIQSLKEELLETKYITRNWIPNLLQHKG